MNELAFLALKEDGFNWTSKDIAEWTGKEHYNILRDIRDEIEKLQKSDMKTKDLFEFIGNSDLNSKKIFTEYYKLSSDGIMQIALRYDSVSRRKLIMRVRELQQAIKDLKNIKTSKKRQLECMDMLHDLLPEAEKVNPINYIKANTVVNKATSTYFGFPKMLKKLDMNKEMLEIRDKIMDDYLALYKFNPDNSFVKEMIYKKWQPKLLKDENNDK